MISAHVIFIQQLHFCFQKSSFLLLDPCKVNCALCVSGGVCLHCCVLHALFHICILPGPTCSPSSLPFLLPPPWRSDARLQPEEPPPCSRRRRSLASRSRLRPTSSIESTPTSTSRSRSSSGCRGNGSRSSRTRPRGPNLLSMPLSSLLWSRARWVFS